MPAMIVVGLGFGDEGKGSIVDSLSDRYRPPVVVRFCGSAQAAHHVVLPDGRWHCFSQWGSGTFSGALTYLSRFMSVAPDRWEHEAAHLQQLGVADPYSCLRVDRECVVVTPYHVAMNQFRELNRELAKHGSCGLGAGEAQWDVVEYPDTVLRVDDLLSGEGLKILKRQYEHKTAQAKMLGFTSLGQLSPETLFILLKAIVPCAQIVDRDWLKKYQHFNLVFEGSQGIMIDETYGFHPHTTWSTVTPKHALTLLEETGYQETVHQIGVLRTYSTRHGAGPFPAEDADIKFPEAHNGAHPWQGKFRQGRFDMALAQYAIQMSGVDCVALTHKDRLGLYEPIGKPIAIHSYGPTRDDKEYSLLPKPIGVYNGTLSR